MKSAFGCTGREEKNSAGAAADWVPCWWKGEKNERFNPNDLCIKKEKRKKKEMEFQANINFMQQLHAWQTEQYHLSWLYWLIYLTNPQSYLLHWFWIILPAISLVY